MWKSIEGKDSPFPPLLSVCCGFFRPSTDLCFLVCLEIEHFLSSCLNLCNHATCFYNFPPHSVCLRGLSMSVHIELTFYSHCCMGLCSRLSPSSSTVFSWICFPHVCQHCILSFFFFLLYQIGRILNDWYLCFNFLVLVKLSIFACICCVSSCINNLCWSFAHFFRGVFVFSLLICRQSGY